MSDTARLHHTYEQYAALDAESPIRHEYLDGEIASWRAARRTTRRWRPP